MTTATGSQTTRNPTFTMTDRLRKAREAADMDQGALAQAIEVSRGTISNYEAGRVEPRAIVLRQWALATGVDLDWIKTGVENDESHRPDGPDGGSTLPHLDSNQKPFGYRVPRVQRVSWMPKAA